MGRVELDFGVDIWLSTSDRVSEFWMLICICRYAICRKVVRLRISSHSTGIERQTKEHVYLYCF